MNHFVRGQPIENPPESIRLFMICSAMNWCHLPLAGGIYDQHPDLLDDWLIIFQAQHEHEKEEAAKQEAKSKKQGGVRRR